MGGTIIGTGRDPNTATFPNQHNLYLHSKYLSLYSQIDVALIHHQRSCLVFFFFFATDRDSYRNPKMVKVQRSVDGRVSNPGFIYLQLLYVGLEGCYTGWGREDCKSQRIRVSTTS